MNSKELRQKFIDFMISKQHKHIPSGSIVPQEDPTVLFINSGMQPLIPFLTGREKHPDGMRLVNSQKCLRTEDINEVGDNRHGTFFEMLGFWGIGEYFKKEAIEWTFEFVTDKKYLGLDPQRLYATVYKGGDVVGVDNEAGEIWKEQFKKVGIDAEIGDEYDFKHPENNAQGQKYVYRITRRSGKDNWWGLPYKGPCGPCAELYYLLPDSPIDFEQSVFAYSTEEEIYDFVENQIVEIGNNVFMTYTGEKDVNKEPISVENLEKRVIDTGLGFERLLMLTQNKSTMFETDVFEPITKVVTKYQNS